MGGCAKGSPALDVLRASEEHQRCRASGGLKEPESLPDRNAKSLVSGVPVPVRMWRPNSTQPSWIRFTVLDTHARQRRLCHPGAICLADQRMLLPFLRTSWACDLVPPAGIPNRLVAEKLRLIRNDKSASNPRIRANDT